MTLKEIRSRNPTKDAPRYDRGIITFVVILFANDRAP